LKGVIKTRTRNVTTHDSTSRVLIFAIIYYETMNHYQISAVPGLAPIVTNELAEVSGAKLLGVRRLRNAELLNVNFDGDPKRLLGLRTAEDAFISLGRLRLTGQLSDMKALASAPVWGTALREGLAEWSRITGRPLVKLLEFRIVVQAEDAQWRQYRRQEMMLAAERAMLTAGTSWRLRREAAPLEIWLQQLDRELLVNLRLSTSDMRQHGGRVVERGAALRPSVAAAMVRLSEPAPDDVFLDPMCGTGTILLERAVAGRYELLLGGDADQAAVDATLENFGPRHQPRRIELWDATKLPLADASVSTIVCNLPWGRQISEQATLPLLYSGMLREAVRVLRSPGRMVLLTSEWDLLKRALRDRPELKLEQTVPNVEILGRRADMFALSR
jgi:tRNA (guanine6-N2)-methyltransferase